MTDQSVLMQRITDALVSHAQLIGRFDKVNSAEPTTPPANGMTCSIWAQALSSLSAESGLSVTTGYLVMQARIYDNVMRLAPDEADQIDPRMLAAASELIDSYTGEFTLAGLVTSIDLLGIGGETLRGEAGYVQIGGQGSGMYRIMTITIPMIIADMWTQVA
jgi:hypothetical protein